jgi:hypothetical protein
LQWQDREAFAQRQVTLELGDRDQNMEQHPPGPWELPVLGAVPPPVAVLVRPDGHVAWVAEGTNRGSLTRSPPVRST